MLGFFSSAFFLLFSLCGYLIQENRPKKRLFFDFPFLFSLVYFVSPSYQKPAVTKTIEFRAREIFIKGFFLLVVFYNVIGAFFSLFLFLSQLNGCLDVFVSWLLEQSSFLTSFYILSFPSLFVPTYTYMLSSIRNPACVG